jgi:hypothetical protein
MFYNNVQRCLANLLLGEVTCLDLQKECCTLLPDYDVEWKKNFRVHVSRTNNLCESDKVKINFLCGQSTIIKNVFSGSENQLIDDSFTVFVKKMNGKTYDVVAISIFFYAKALFICSIFMLNRIIDGS